MPPPARPSLRLRLGAARVALGGLVALAACGGSDSTPTDGPDGSPLQLMVTGGRVEGFRESGVDHYLGIPYAAPPVGELRWRPPEPVVPWDTVLRADAFRAGPIQHNVFGDMRYRSPGFSEDCLYLNVWAPAGPRDGLPVLLYLYGGGLVAGDASESRYDGAAFARDSVIVVAPNYRLNVFGFLAHPELSAESPDGVSGNYGLLDQAAALSWVRDNIAAFGGDSTRVTLGGESAGASSVSTMLASPLTRDLVAGAIVQSGAAVTPRWEAVALDTAEAIGSAFAKTIGAPTLAELRALPADSLYARYRRTGRFGFPEVVDSVHVVEPLPAAYRARRVAAVPLLAGWTSREAAPEQFMWADSSAVSLRSRIRDAFPAYADELIAALPAETPDEVELAARTLAGDVFAAAPTWALLNLHARYTPAPAYRYLWDQPRPGEAGGARHAGELAYAFDALDVHVAFPWREEDQVAADNFHGYLVNFVRTGDPNGPGLPAWTPLAKRPGEMTQPVQRIAAEVTPELTDDARYPILLRALTGEPWLP